MGQIVLYRNVVPIELSVLRFTTPSRQNKQATTFLLQKYLK